MMPLRPRPVEVVNRDCPFCDKTHEIEHHVELAQLPVNNEPVDCVVEYFLCPITTCDDGNTWCPAGMLNENLLRAREAYRTLHNILLYPEKESETHN